LRSASTEYRFEDTNVLQLERIACFMCLLGLLQYLEVTGFQLLFTSWCTTWSVEAMLLLPRSEAVPVIEPF
jgi:hypothetical protein